MNGEWEKAARPANDVFKKLCSKRAYKKAREYVNSGLFCWRRDRDLNPGYAINVNTISSRAPSATQPSLHDVRLLTVLELY